MTNPTPRDSAQLPPAEFIADLTQNWDGPWARAADEIIEALRAQAASVPVPFTFSPMWLAPLDGSPVMLYLPTTTDKFAVGIWYGGHGGCWGDDEGNYYVHEPVAFCSLANLERFTIRPAPQPQALAASSPATAVKAPHQELLDAMDEIIADEPATAVDAGAQRELSDEAKRDLWRWFDAFWADATWAPGTNAQQKADMKGAAWGCLLDFNRAALQASRQPQAQQAVAEGAGERLHIAINMLAEWCVAVDVNGAGWDDWDEHYKDAMWRPGPLRELLDKEIAAVRATKEANHG